MSGLLLISFDRCFDRRTFLTLRHRFLYLDNLYLEANYMSAAELDSKMQACIDACMTCLKDCEYCMTACLSSDMANKMTECIKRCRDCADTCTMCVRFMSRQSEIHPYICRACAEACDRCAEECGSHQSDHCQRCAESCRKCAELCRQMAA